MKRTRIILASDIHYCEGGWYGIPRDRKAEELCEDLAYEYKKEPYSALLLLGDYSLDHWVWKTKGTYLTRGISDTKLFVDRYLHRLLPEGVECRMIAGNHEQYGEKLYEELTGYKRRDHIVCGDLLFILTDTFGGDLDPTDHSDGTYIGVNMADITALMTKHSDKKVIICAHSFDMEQESEEFKALLRSENRILCLICGHNHKSIVSTTGEENGNKPILYTGNYSYSGEEEPTRCLSGYRELIITDSGISSKYISPAHTYTIKGNTFTSEYTEQDAIEIAF
ncbi:MAG: metallophosphoesterase [Clostridia bacterium]|nr:metallophosphoesterase [Clostridia bacterium]